MVAHFRGFGYLFFRVAFLLKSSRGPIKGSVRILNSWDLSSEKVIIRNGMGSNFGKAGGLDACRVHVLQNRDRPCVVQVPSICSTANSYKQAILQLAQISPPPIPQTLVSSLGSDGPRACTQPHLSALPFLLKLPVYFCTIPMRPVLVSPWVTAYLSGTVNINEHSSIIANFKYFLKKDSVVFVANS